jgi:hypothetical protein
VALEGFLSFRLIIKNDEMRHFFKKALAGLPVDFLAV